MYDDFVIDALLLMTFDETMAELEALGTAENRKVYPRHGVKEPMFGVSYASLGKLEKKLEMDHGLAVQLWQTGNHDARVFATIVADPKMATAPLLEDWVKDLDNYVLTNAFSGYVGKTPHAGDMMRTWIDANAEFAEAAGWNLLGSSAMYAKGLPDDVFHPYIERIERDIHGAKNRVRYAMNNAIIAIGTRSDELEVITADAAKRIGKVEVDHGKTGCKTPDATSYIPKARAHQRKKEAKGRAA